MAVDGRLLLLVGGEARGDAVRDAVGGTAARAQT